MFKVGATYTRHDIHAAVGGSVQSYLPIKDGKVVAVCLTKEYNPDAPRVILVGKGPIIESAGNLLSQQVLPVPVFMKKVVNEWEYQGMFKVVRHIVGSVDMQPYVKRSGRSDVVRVIFLEQV